MWCDGDDDDEDESEDCLGGPPICALNNSGEQ